jgi:hypothetical protein
LFSHEIRSQKSLTIEIDSDDEDNETTEVNALDDCCKQKGVENVFLEKRHNHIALEKAIDTGMRIKKGLIILISFYQRVKKELNQVMVLYIKIFNL